MEIPEECLLFMMNVQDNCDTLFKFLTVMLFCSNGNDKQFCNDYYVFYRYPGETHLFFLDFRNIELPLLLFVFFSYQMVHFHN